MGCHVQKIAVYRKIINCNFVLKLNKIVLKVNLQSYKSRTQSIKIQ